MDMTLDRLREIVEAYGAAAHRWPVAEREAALALVTGNSDARALVDEALTLDLMLDAAPAPAPASTELVARIMAARPRAVAVAAVAGNLALWPARHSRWCACRFHHAWRGLRLFRAHGCDDPWQFRSGTDGQHHGYDD